MDASPQAIAPSSRWLTSAPCKEPFGKRARNGRCSMQGVLPLLPRAVVESSLSAARLQGAPPHPHNRRADTTPEHRLGHWSSVSSPAGPP
ncbi:hypothetical protein BU14_2091s0001 [Porphyra umbilicalis]|uniref:Uncharacterized protein n=1 Tax=Porphyra umbilicalis TaxID=2786 RepID=A0A1X6NJZ2_PORUM|nr:hypothetical protein BU14_2091s0001 [Porphyra umbilicalis]|eukprot:OSX68918.1 hypothetical protein BU14_2091s0001 [Porphyra umbilicalis]